MQKYSTKPLPSFMQKTVTRNEELCKKKNQHYHHIDKAFEASMMPMQNLYDCSNITPNYCGNNKSRLELIPSEFPFVLSRKKSNT